MKKQDSIKQYLTDVALELELRKAGSIIASSIAKKDLINIPHKKFTEKVSKSLKKHIDKK